MAKKIVKVTIQHDLDELLYFITFIRNILKETYNREEVGELISYTDDIISILKSLSTEIFPISKNTNLN